MTEGDFHSYSPTYKDPALEQQFHVCYRQLHDRDWFGRWGTFFKLWLSTGLGVSRVYADHIMSLLMHSTLDQTPGSIERVVFTWGNIQLTLLCARVMAKSLLGRWSPTVSETRRLAFEWMVYTIAIEFLTADVNEMFSAHHGCAAQRFRCPHSLFSPQFTTRMCLIDIMMVFHLTPYVPFPLVALMVLVGTSCTRLAGLLLYDVELSLGGWVIAMLYVQKLVFLVCRYRSELSSRRQFLVDRRAAQLHSDLARLLDSLVPPRFSRRAALEEYVVEPHDHATVLFCTFSSPQA